MKRILTAVILQNWFVLISVAALPHWESGRQSQMQLHAQSQLAPKIQLHLKAESQLHSQPQPQPKAQSQPQSALNGQSQTQPQLSTKLAVIISLDQFPYEYLTRFQIGRAHV